MQQPRIRLGSDDVWLELARTGEDTWQVTADWCSWLTADFTADLSTAEAVDFVARMLSHLNAPSGGRFSAAVTPGRNNPLTLNAEPVGSGFAFFVRLTPNGDDDVCHLQMEIDPIATSELREMFHALHTALVV
ncbi:MULTISPECIES: hypothetical protein [unclassified Streptomyces]|uniref:hypothetical protein n=1 Tax=unclassified Streptomyces TaxID=2593676 RepID=UPI002DD9177F|nr:MULTISPECIES: hypothetical protein [unclassified Streptomyces]WSF89460.1 hypothetical protein OIE70_44245 [Streptomyces sp. NBC_01744]WSC34370.1 hypothetical protein OHA08_01675 [Streptomyces sp. NBC_01763]WSC58357.1 hypothetical protein OG808_42675 [Streptomyces sp. NBC_01761]WSD22323.1 hypothetical protein OHA26_01600 [Streptomyces sp. NBC_01751]WSJ55662.1 hypothetical protein OG243_42775 [Streptomyces sp. NBC_01318]